MPAKIYDVLIVGSGHSGGMAANILTKHGVECLMLNAGPEPDFEHNRVNKAGLRFAVPRLRPARALAARLSSQRIQRQPVGG